MNYNFYQDFLEDGKERKGENDENYWSVDSHLQSPIQDEIRNYWYQEWIMFLNNEKSTNDSIGTVFKQIIASFGHKAKFKIHSEVTYPSFWNMDVNSITDDEQVKMDNRIVNKCLITQLEALNKVSKSRLFTPIIEYMRVNPFNSNTDMDRRVVKLCGIHHKILGRLTHMNNDAGQWKNFPVESAPTIATKNIRPGYGTRKQKDDENIKRTRALSLIGNYGNFKIYMVDKMIIMEDIHNTCDNNLYIYDHNQFNCIMDTLLSRWAVLTYSLNAFGVSHEVIPPPEVIKRVLLWGDRLISQMGNKAYSIIKFYERLCISTLLDLYEPGDNSRSEFSLETEHQLQDVAKSLSIDNPMLFTIFDFLKETCSSSTIIEMYGLYRIWGHPTVDVTGAAKKYKRIARQTLPTVNDTTRKCNGLVIEIFVRNYITKHGIWPPCSIDEQFRDTTVYKLWKNKSRLSSLQNVEYDPSVWCHMAFSQIFDFDTYQDLDALLADKSIAPYKSELYRIFYNGQKNKNYRREYKSSRRLLLQFLQSPDFNLRDYLEIFKRRNYPDEWLIMVLTAKEREMKIVPRLFASLVLEARCVLLSCEHNLGSQLFNYYPSVTMSLDEIKLQKLMSDYSHESINKTTHQMYISVDFDKWNLRMRQEMLYPIYDFYSQIFGEPGLWTSIHPFIQQCTIAVQSERYDLPQDLDDLKTGESIDRVWVGHDAIMEGLMQKAWTIAGTGIFSLLSRELGKPVRLLCQGDNVIVIIELQKEKGVTTIDHIQNNYREIYAFRERVRSTLNRITDEYGLPIQTRETFINERLLTFGKSFMLDGSSCSMSLKRISRIFANSPEPFPTVESAFTTCSGSTSATCGKSYTCLTSLCICIRQQLLSLHAEFKHSVILGYPLIDHLNLVSNYNLLHSLNCIEDYFCFLVMLPSQLGGLNTVNVWSLLARGQVDPLTGAISFCDKMSEDETWKRALKYCAFNIEMNEEVDFSLLMMNPTAIPLASPNSGNNFMTKKINKNLLKITRNKNLLEIIILKQNNQNNDNLFLKQLCNFSPCLPYILSSVYDASLDGIVNTVLSLVNNSKTASFMSGLRLNEISSRIASNCASKISYTIKLFLQGKDRLCTNRYNTCHKLAQYYRDIGWFPDGSNTISEVTSPHPFDIFILESETTHLATCADNIKCKTGQKFSDSNNYISTVFCPISDNSQKGLAHLVRGTQDSYLGAITQKKVTQNLIQLQKRTRPIRMITQLMSLRNWITSPGDNFREVIDNLICARSNISLGLLNQCAKNYYGGTTKHRHTTRYISSKVAVNHCGEFASHLYHSTDTMNTNRDKDHDIYYQEALVMNTAYLSEIGHFHKWTITGNALAFHWHLIDNVDVPTQNDQKISGELIRNTDPIRIENPFLYTHINTKRLQKACPNAIVQYQDIREMIPLVKARDMKNVGAWAIATECRLSMGPNPDLTRWNIRDDSSVKTHKSDISLKEISDIGVNDILLSIAMLSDGVIVKHIMQKMSVYHLWGEYHLQIFHRVMKVMMNSICAKLNYPMLRDELREYIQISTKHYLWPQGEPHIAKAITGSSIKLLRNIREQKNGIKIIYTIPVNQNLAVDVYVEWLIVDMIYSYPKANLLDIQVLIKSILRHSYNIHFCNINDFRVIYYDTVFSSSRRIKEMFEGYIPLLNFVVTPLEVIRYSYRDTSNKVPSMTRKVRSIRNIKRGDTNCIDKKLTDYLSPHLFSIKSTSQQVIYNDLRPEDNSNDTRRFPIMSLIKKTGQYQTSHYKWLPIINDYVSDNSTIFSLGDGSGGITRLICETKLIKKVFWISLLSDINANKHHGLHCLPVECLNIQQRDKIMIPPECFALSNDLCNIKTWDAMSGYVYNYGHTIMINDVQSSAPKIRQIEDNCISFLTSNPGSVDILISKFYWNDDNYNMNRLSVLCQLFKRIVVRGSIYSNPSSNEVYIICSNPFDERKKSNTYSFSSGTMGNLRNYHAIRNAATDINELVPKDMCNRVDILFESLGFDNNWESAWNEFCECRYPTPDCEIKVLTLSINSILVNILSTCECVESSSKTRYIPSIVGVSRLTGSVPYNTHRYIDIRLLWRVLKTTEILLHNKTTQPLDVLILESVKERLKSHRKYKQLKGKMQEYLLRSIDEYNSYDIRCVLRVLGHVTR